MEAQLAVEVGDLESLDRLWIIPADVPSGRKDGLNSLKLHMVNLFEDVSKNRILNKYLQSDQQVVTRLSHNDNISIERGVVKSIEDDIVHCFLLDRGQMKDISLDDVAILPTHLAAESKQLAPLAQILNLKNPIQTSCKFGDLVQHFESLRKSVVRFWLEEVEKSENGELRGHLFCEFPASTDTNLHFQTPVDVSRLCINSSMELFVKNMEATKNLVSESDDDISMESTKPDKARHDTLAKLLEDHQTDTLDLLVYNQTGSAVVISPARDKSEDQGEQESCPTKTSIVHLNQRQVERLRVEHLNLHTKEQLWSTLTLPGRCSPSPRRITAEVAAELTASIGFEAGPELLFSFKVGVIDVMVMRKPVTGAWARSRKSGWIMFLSTAITSASSSDENLNKQLLFDRPEKANSRLQAGVRYLPSERLPKLKIQSSVESPNLNKFGLILNQTQYIYGSSNDIRHHVENISYVGPLVPGQCLDPTHRLIVISNSNENRLQPINEDNFFYRGYFCSRLWVTFKSFYYGARNKVVTQLQFSYRPDTLDYDPHLAGSAPAVEAITAAERNLANETTKQLKDAFTFDTSIRVPKPSAHVLPATQTMFTHLDLLGTRNMLCESIGNFNRSPDPWRQNNEFLVSTSDGYPYLPQIYRYQSRHTKAYVLRMRIVHYTRCDISNIDYWVQDPLCIDSFDSLSKGKSKKKRRHQKMAFTSEMEISNEDDHYYDKSRQTHIAHPNSDGSSRISTTMMYTNPLNILITDESTAPLNFCRVDLYWYKVEEIDKGCQDAAAQGRRKCTLVPCSEVRLPTFSSLMSSDADTGYQRKSRNLYHSLAKELTTSELPLAVARMRLKLAYKYQSSYFRPDAGSLYLFSCRGAKGIVGGCGRITEQTPTNLLSKFQLWNSNQSPQYYCCTVKQGAMMVVSNNRVMSCMAAASIPSCQPDLTSQTFSTEVHQTTGSWAPAALQVDIFTPKLTVGHILLMVYSLANMRGHDNSKKARRTKLGLGLCAFSNSKWEGEELTLVCRHMLHNNPSFSNISAIAAGSQHMFEMLQDGLEAPNCGYIQTDPISRTCLNTTISGIKFFKRQLMELEITVAKELQLSQMSWTTYAEKVIRPFQEMDLADIILSPFESEDFVLTEPVGRNYFSLNMYERALLTEDELRHHEIEFISWLRDVNAVPALPWREYVRNKVSAQLGLIPFASHQPKSMTEKEYDVWSLEKPLGDVNGEVDVSGSVEVVAKRKRSPSKKTYKNPNKKREIILEEQTVIDDVITDGTVTEELVFPSFYTEAYVQVEIDGRSNTDHM